MSTTDGDELGTSDGCKLGTVDDWIGGFEQQIEGSTGSIGRNPRCRDVPFHQVYRKEVNIFLCVHECVSRACNPLLEKKNRELSHV